MSEEPRVMKNLLLRGNTLAGTVAATLDLVAAGRRDIEELTAASLELRAWAADVRAVASEQRP